MIENFGNKNRKRDIKYFLKNKLNFSYKRGSSKPKAFSSNRNKLFQVIYSSKILRNINNDKYLINIDEASFNRSLKNNYSWMPKGITNSIINDTAKGRWSIIAAICSNGEYLIQIFLSTVDSEKYQQFIWILNFAIKAILKNKHKDVIVWCDNASVHSSDSTKKLFDYLNLNIFYLPPYCPHLAPVELLFKIIKTKIRSKFSEIEVNFEKDSGKQLIYNSMNDVTPFHIKQLWKWFVKEAKKLIIFFFTK